MINRIILNQINSKGYINEKFLMEKNKKSKIYLRVEKNNTNYFAKIISTKYLAHNKIYQKFLYKELKKISNFKLNKFLIKIFEYFYITCFIVIIYENIEKYYSLNYILKYNLINKDNIIFIIKEVYKICIILKKNGYTHINLNTNNIYFLNNQIKINQLKYIWKFKTKISEMEKNFLISNSKIILYFPPEFVTNNMIYNNSFLWNIGILFFKLKTKSLPIDFVKISNLLKIYQSKYYKINLSNINIFYKNLLEGWIQINYNNRINHIEFQKKLYIYKTNIINFNDLLKPLKQRKSKISVNFNSIESLIIKKKQINSSLDNNLKLNQRQRILSVIKICKINKEKVNQESRFFKKSINKFNKNREEIFKIKKFQKLFMLKKLKYN